MATAEEIAAQYLSSSGISASVPDEEDEEKDRQSIADRYLTDAGVGSTEPKAKKGKAAQQEVAPQTDSIDTIVGGLQKARNTLAGDSTIAQGQSENIPADIRQRFGDVTEGERLGAGGRVQKAIGGDVLPAVGEAISEYIPEPVKEGLSSAVAWMKQNKQNSPQYSGVDIGGTIGPEASTALSEIANIASLVAPVPKFGKTTFGDRSALKLARENVNRRAKQTKRMLDPDKIDPLKTKVSPTLKNYESIPSDWDKRMIARVNKIDDFNPEGNLVENIQAIDRKISELGQKLTDDLADAPMIRASEVDDLLKAQIEAGKNNYLLTGDAGTAATRLYNMFDDIVKPYIKNGEISPADLLAARKAFDAKVTAMNKGIFDSASTTASTEATRGLRNAINSRIAEAAPDVNVLESLSHQADLYNANKTLIPRAQKQAKTGPGRAVQQVETETGLAPARSPEAARANVMSPGAMAIAGVGSVASLGKRALAKAFRSTRTGTARGAQGLTNATLMALPPAERAAILAALQEEQENN